MRLKSAAFLSVVLACVLVTALFPAAAQAYFTFGTVKVSTGAARVSVQAGATTTTSISVSPSSDEQTEGCGMAECPQSCGPGCLDKNGQCTCAGSSYSTYRTEVSASSSNNAVATARVSGGTLQVTGKSAGTATITVSASLRQWNSGSTKVQVNVTEAPSSSSQSGSSSSSSSQSAQPSSGAPATVNIPPAASATQSRDDALNEKVVETSKGMKVYSVEINSYLNTETELTKIAGTDDRCIFWSGTNSSTPDYSWSFNGKDIDTKSAYLQFDPTISVSDLGTRDVSSIMEQAKDGLVLDFAHEGQLPSAAGISVKVPESYADGTTLTLFAFDSQTGKFVKAEDDVKVEAGYASFSIDHCSTWALSTDDLTTYAVVDVVSAGASGEGQGASTAEPNMFPIVIVIVVAVVAAAVIAVFAIRLRKRPEDVSADGVDEEKGADDEAAAERASDEDAAACASQEHAGEE